MYWGKIIGTLAGVATLKPWFVLLGLLLGALVGGICTLWFQYNGLYIPGMDAISEQYNLPDRMYPQLSVLSALLGPGIVFLGGLLAAIYPSLRLYLLQPVAAMRAV